MQHSQDFTADGPPPSASLNRLAQTAASVGREVVDIDGFLADLTDQTEVMLKRLKSVRDGSGKVLQMNASVMTTIQEAFTHLEQTQSGFVQSLVLAEQANGLRQEVVHWVEELNKRARGIESVIEDVQESNQQIAAIAAQVNMLAINAKIEAARAGESGRGFSVVADAINQLSQRTGTAADQVSDNVERLVGWIAQLQKESGGIAEKSRELNRIGDESGAMQRDAGKTLDLSVSRMTLVRDDARVAEEALKNFSPEIAGMVQMLEDSADGVTEAHDRVTDLVDMSEAIVQDSVAIGGDSEDILFIRDVQERAAQLSSLLDEAVETGRITLEDLFDTSYKPISGTNPTQFLTRYTKLTDKLFPPVQDPALDLDRRVVFCAAVDRNGYLPTHNAKFSQPQGDDPVWNTANSRNRRMFDDRVGMKAGQVSGPFLLQCYRREMGGGTFKLLKDVSAPIRVKNRHWGGLRLAYTF